MEIQAKDLHSRTNKLNEYVLTLGLLLTAKYMQNLRSRSAIGPYMNFKDELTKKMKVLAKDIESLSEAIHKDGAQLALVADEQSPFFVAGDVAIQAGTGRQTVAIRYLENNAPSIMAMLNSWGVDSHDVLSSRLIKLSDFFHNLSNTIA